MKNIIIVLLILLLDIAGCATFKQDNALVIVSECKPYKIVNGKYTLQCKKENLTK
jgi:hypothetical protein